MAPDTEYVYRGPKRTEPASAGSEAQGANWVLFAGIVVAVAGVLNIIWGIAAVGKSHFFAKDAQYLVSDLKTWGWIIIALGIAQIAAAYSIWRGGQAGRWFGIAIAALSLIGALMSIDAYPFWSLTVVALDVLVIYGLAAYGGQHLRV